MSEIPERQKRWLTKTEVLFFCLGAVLGVILGEFWPENASKFLSKSYVTTVFGVIFSLIGFLLALFFRILHESFPNFQSSVVDQLDQTQALIGRTYSILNIKDQNRSVFELTSEFANDSVAHLLSEGDAVHISEYVRLLESSLEKCTKELYATSLILPNVWLNQGLYKEYLHLQRRKKMSNPDIRMSRVFIAEKEKFERDSRLAELIEEHKKAKISIGWYNKSDLNAINPEYVRDFVKFENEHGIWIVDAGTLPENADPSLTWKIKLIFRAEEIGSRYHDIFRRFEHVQWMWRERP